MSSPFSTPVKQVKLGLASSKSLPLANEYKKLLNEQYQRLWIKHQQDLDLLDDIRGYVKARLSIERDYTTALNKLAKSHSNHISKKFILLNQCDVSGNCRDDQLIVPGGLEEAGKNEQRNLHGSDASDIRLQKRLVSNGFEEPKVCTLYKVWSEHINRLNSTSKNRIEQFDQLFIVADKLKDIRSHKAAIGKKCLDAHLRKIHEDLLSSMIDVEKARKLYYEDESQAKKARENEEKIKKKRSGLLTKFTDLQAKKEKTSAQREANDIQSTQARNDYIMALAAANAHLQHYYQRDLSDFIHLIDDGVLDHCKIFMATLSECDLNSLKDSLSHAQYWSKMINLTGSQRTNSIFLECDQSTCLRNKSKLAFEACNEDPIQVISLEHNADYALQHEIDKWFTWFKKECRNLSQLMHQLDMCQKAYSEGKKSIELNGQTSEDIESKIIELKQQIRKSEAAKLKAQARLKVIKEGGMQIEEWSSVESEIRADMARAQEEMEAKRAKEMMQENDLNQEASTNVDQPSKQTTAYMFDNQLDKVQLQVSKNSDDSDDAGESIHNLAAVSRSTSNIQQNIVSSYNALTDPSLVWQDDYTNAWGDAPQAGNYNVVVTDTFSNKSPTETKPPEPDSGLLGANTTQVSNHAQQNQQSTSMTVQSSSPLSAIVDGVQSASSPYQGITGEAYKSDYECDYSRNGGHLMRSAASSVEPHNRQQHQANTQQMDPFGRPIDSRGGLDEKLQGEQLSEFGEPMETNEDPSKFLNQTVIAIYSFDKTNEDDLSFNENDLLKVTQINDANWVKARNELTGEEGYVPVSYIRILDDKRVRRNSAQSKEWKNFQGAEWSSQNEQQLSQSKADAEICYCRALYDHATDGTLENEDGLPHLSLTQGELMRIIDRGQDDGWWLVEKEASGVRGHVPSMLVEEMDFDDGEEEEDYDQDDVSQYSNYDYEGSIKAMPTFEPPVLKEEAESCVESTITDAQDNQENSTSTIPTSFINIEPTSAHADDTTGLDMKGENERQSSTNTSQLVRETKTATDAPYSLINEEYVLEKPNKKPHQQSPEVTQHHETPTILEEVDGENQESAQISDLKMPDGNYEPLSEVDSVDMPAPPVVIEIFESEKQTRSDSSEYDDEVPEENSNDYVQREIKHTGNVDVNPMLRHRAEEFSKQIITEALMMTSDFTDIEPTTSTATLD